MGDLIHLEPNRLVNTDTIASIKASYSPGGAEQMVVTFIDGRRETLPYSIESVEWRVGPIVPAPDGYTVIRAFEPEKAGDPMEFATYPVIAFRLTENEPVPVTPFGKLGDHWALVWPDGRCDETWNRLWPSVQAFKASFGPDGVRS